MSRSPQYQRRCCPPLPVFASLLHLCRRHCLPTSTCLFFFFFLGLGCTLWIAELNLPQKYGKTLVPKEVISAVFGDTFSGRQQDAHELFQYISSKMSDENTRLFGRDVVKGIGVIQDSEHDDPRQGGDEGGLYRPQNPLLGLVGSTMLCAKCSQKVFRACLLHSAKLSSLTYFSFFSSSSFPRRPSLLCGRTSLTTSRSQFPSGVVCLWRAVCLNTCGQRRLKDSCARGAPSWPPSPASRKSLALGPRRPHGWPSCRTS